MRSLLTTDLSTESSRGDGLASRPASPLAGLPRRRALCGLFVCKTGWRLTLRGYLCVLAALALACVAALFTIHPWLCVTSRVPSVCLVVEGWIGVGGLEQAFAEFRRGGYNRILTSGAMAPHDLSPDKKRTYADWSAQELTRLGAAPDAVTPIPSWVENKDRTYYSAIAVRDWLRDNHITLQSVNVVSLGSHARRTRLMYEKALGNGIKVGIIAARDSDYDPRHWWQTSEGTRDVIGETIAYVYARIFFHPGEETPTPDATATN